MNPNDYHFNNEIIINKCVQVLDQTCYGLSLAEDNDQQYLWVMYKRIQYKDVCELQAITYREQYEMSAISNNIHPSMSFRNIIFQGQRSEINTAQYFYTSKISHHTSEQFSHFQNDSFNILDRDSDYYIIRMTLKTPVRFNSNKPLTLSLQKRDDNIIHFINKVVTFDYDNEQIIDIEHPITHKMMKYRFSPLLNNDVWSNFNEKAIPNHSQERIRKDYLALCPEDEVLQMIAYEVEEELYLSMYTVDTLKSPIQRNQRSSAMGIFYGYKFDNDKALRSYSCNLGHVKATNKQLVSTEIFSIHIKREGLWYEIE